MDTLIGTQIISWGGVAVGTAVGVTTAWNNIAIRREANRQRRIQHLKTEEDAAVIATQATIDQLTSENARLWRRLEKLDSDFEGFKLVSKQRDDEYREKIATFAATAERNRGQLMFLRREIMGLFKRISSAIRTENGDSKLGVGITEEISAFIQSVHDELGPLGENAVIIGNEGAERRLGQ